MTSQVKIVVTVPLSDGDKLRAAIAQAGAGQIGNYSACSFSSVGTGRFLPGLGANPTIGTSGKPEEVAEERIEVTCARDKLAKVVAAIRRAHPYEEPSIDIYELLDLE